MKLLHFDIETYSPENLNTAGLYKYTEHEEFEILIVAFCIEDFGIKGDVKAFVFSEESAEKDEFEEAFRDHTRLKWAHNANFERVCLEAMGWYTKPSSWRCSAVLASTCGLPKKLATLSEVLNLKSEAKDKAGIALINFFSKPCKPTKANGRRTRNLPEHDLDKWESYIFYCKQDVVAEMAVCRELESLPVQNELWIDYVSDMEINDRGVHIDTLLVNNAIKTDSLNKQKALQELKDTTELPNPNSDLQLLDWINTHTGDDYQKFDKEQRSKIVQDHAFDEVLKRVMSLKNKISKRSTSKFNKMLQMLCKDSTVKGTLLFYGAHTGRWAGRGLQTHNLPRTALKNLDHAIFTLLNVPEYFSEEYPQVSESLASLIRPALRAKKGCTFYVADYSAIEAVVLAWLVNEKWRLDVFNTHGKIYEASASAMFGAPLEDITKDSDYRAKGKISELALGYGGSKGAMEQMGASAMGIDPDEIPNIVSAWRTANPNIVNFWRDINRACINAIRLQIKEEHPTVLCSGKLSVFTRRVENVTILCIKLPSDRELRYWDAKIGINKFDSDCVDFIATDSKGKLTIESTYGGKLTENIVQAIARDLLMYAINNAIADQWRLVMHVHDEMIAQEPVYSSRTLEDFCKVMAEKPHWAADMPVKAEGYVSDYYKKG